MSYETPVLIVNEASKVLARRKDSSLELPTVSIEDGRAGIALSRAVRKQLHLEIFSLVLPMLADNEVPALRPQAPRPLLSEGFVWADAAEVGGARTSITGIVEACSPGDRAFGSYGWYSEVTAWLVREVALLGHSVCSLEQWNGRGGGILLRVVTDGPQFWFKAVSDFNAREFGIARLLAAQHPELFPRVVAAEPAWGGLLLEHIVGVELYECNDITIWRDVAARLANLQIDWMERAADLLVVGAADLRAETMAAKIPDFLDHVDDAMARQPKTPPSRLTRVDLEELGDKLNWLCGEVSELQFANGLANADFSPHNTLITSRGPVFIDWAEACVSLPLIAGEYLWNRMAVETPARIGWQDSLREAYLSGWIRRHGPRQVERAALLLPAFSILAVAMFYHERECHGPSPYDCYLRSLVRKLERAMKSTSTTNCLVEA
jgi:pimeloyl-ACP methyl ester carboxylesterase